MAGDGVAGVEGVVPAGVRVGARVPGAVAPGVRGVPTGALACTWREPRPLLPEAGAAPGPGVAADVGVASAATGVAAGASGRERPEAGAPSTVGSEGPSATWPSEASPPKPAPAASSTAAPSSTAGASAVTPAALVACRRQSVVNSTWQW